MITDLEFTLSGSPGIVHDVIEDPYNDCYIVVGEFDYVTDGGGNYGTVQNMAFINRSDMSFNSMLSGMIPSIDGPIYTAAIVESLIPNQVYIYIGGEFANIDLDPRYCIARFEGTVGNPGSFSFSNSWDAEIAVDYGGEYVRHMEVKGDTIFVAGSFFGFNETSTYDISTGLAAFQSNSTDFNLFTGFNWFDQNTGISEVADVDVADDGLYIVGQNLSSGTLHKLNFDGSTNTSFSPPTDEVYDFEYWQTDSSLLVKRWLSGSSTQSMWIDNTNGGLWGPIPDLGSPNKIESYKNKIFLTASNYLMAYDTVSNSISWQANLNANYRTIGTLADIPFSGCFKVLDNRLFVSGSNLTTAEGVTSTGLAVYCLEPSDAETFTEYDTTICPGQDSVLFAIAPVMYATDYIWEYSGQGATFMDPPYDSLYPGDSVYAADSILLNFGFDFTPGILTATPVSECGETSKPISIQIFGAPLPNVYAGLDTTLNCIRDSVTLIGTSSTPNTTTQWWNPASVVPVPGTTITVGIDSSFIFEVIDSVGCSNFDTVAIAMDTVRPIANNIPTPYDLTCSVTSRLFTGSSDNASDSIAWRYSGSLFSNPVTASTVGTYMLIATDRINGCADSSKAAVVQLDQNPPNLGILNYPAYSPIAYLETITCTNDSIELVTTSSNIDAITSWTNADSTALYGDSLIITTSGTYYITATDTSNGCSTYKQVLIDADTIQPNVILPLSSDLTCSADSVELNGSSSVSPVTLEWTGSSITPSANPVMVYNQGWYQLSVTNATNGCSNSDSVLVGYTPEIIVSIDNDTTICNLENVTLTAQYIGSNITGITYLWDNGSTTNTSSYTGGQDNYAIVEVFGDNSCYGKDTAFITIPPAPTPDIQTFQPCASDNDGQLVANLIGGWAPFTYAIHPDSAYQSSPVFQNLVATNYQVQVLDSLGCHYSFSASINENSNLPQPLFLVSTNNFVSDTVVLVDVSSPPTDSTFWTFPPTIEVLDSNAIAPVIILPDTGSYEIIMTAYFGSCEIILSKWIYSAEYDTTYANHVNQNGIKSIALYPNPNDGNFNLEIEFYKKQQVGVTIQDINGNLYYNQQYFETDLIEEYIQLNNTITGTYILKVVAEYDSGSIPFIINE